MSDKKELDQTLQTVVKDLMRKKAGTFVCWKEKNGENHCLYSTCSNEEFVDLLAHLIACRSKSSPFHWKSAEVLSKLKDRMNV